MTPLPEGYGHINQSIKWVNKAITKDKSFWNFTSKYFRYINYDNWMTHEQFGRLQHVFKEGELNSSSDCGTFIFLWSPNLSSTPPPPHLHSIGGGGRDVQYIFLQHRGWAKQLPPQLMPLLTPWVCFTNPKSTQWAPGWHTTSCLKPSAKVSRCRQPQCHYPQT